MKKLMGVAALATVATAGFAGTAAAEGSFSGNVALTSDYVFRGVSQSDSDIAIQGGFDYASTHFRRHHICRKPWYRYQDWY